MSPKEEGYVRSINCTGYEELSQSLKVKYFMAVQSFSLAQNIRMSCVYETYG